MIDEILWRARRLAHFAQRSYGSVALRGWRGTLQRLWQERSRLRPGRGRKERHAEPSPELIEPVTAPVATRGRLLIIDSMTPDPDRDSGSMRLCHIFQLLHEDGWTIDFFADDGYATQADIRRLASLGVRTGRGNLLDWLRKNGSSLDAVMLCRLANANQYHPLVRRMAPNAQLIFDTVDLHYMREARAAEIAGSTRLRRRAAHSRRAELAAIAHSDVTLVVSAHEQAEIARELPASRVELLTNIHPVHPPALGYEKRRDLLFIGGFGHPPNADAMQWFVGEVLPKIRAEDPSIGLHIAGDIDERSRRALARPGVVVLGRVANLAPLINSSRLSVAPLRFGAGVKGKVNLAMSHGLPVVLTSIAAEGMYLKHGTNALIADRPDEFAQAVLAGYRDALLWRRLSLAGQENIRDHFSVELARETLRRVFDAPAVPDKMEIQ